MQVIRAQALFFHWLQAFAASVQSAGFSGSLTTPVQTAGFSGALLTPAEHFPAASTHPAALSDHSAVSTHPAGIPAIVAPLQGGLTASSRKINAAPQA